MDLVNLLLYTDLHAQKENVSWINQGFLYPQLNPLTIPDECELVYCYHSLTEYVPCFLFCLYISIHVHFK